jgi:Transposase
VHESGHGLPVHRSQAPNALIVADRFHVIRLINQHFWLVGGISIRQAPNTEGCCR